MDPNNKAKIRPVLLSLSGLPKSGKTRAIKHLLEHYVDSSPFIPMPSQNECVSAEAEEMGITFHELIAAGFRPSRKLTITKVTEESCFTFGILSAFNTELERGDPRAENQHMFDDNELNGHIHNTFDYLSKEKHMPCDFAERLNIELPKGIALMNIWDLTFNKSVLHFLSAMSGHLYNSYTWLFLDLDRDIDELDKPPFFPDYQDGRVLMQWRPRLHYLVRACKISQNETGNIRHNACTIFAKHQGIVNKEKVVILKTRVHQTAKHVGVLPFLDSEIEPINFDSPDDDNSLRLYQKFQQVICKTPYQDVPLSWVFLRSLFYKSQKIFIPKEELKAKAKECGMDDGSFAEFCKFYTSFGSIFDLSLINPDYPYVIVKPIDFLKSLDKILKPRASYFKSYPTMEYSIIPEKVCQFVYLTDCPAFMEALISIGFVVRVSRSNVRLTMENLDHSEIYYYIPFCCKSNSVTEVDPTAVHLITSSDTPPIFKLANLVKYLLKLLPNPKLVPCKHANKAIIEDSSANVRVTITSHSPATKIDIDNANPDVCSYVIQACQKIAEKGPNAKFKFVIICAEDNKIVGESSIPSCQHHILPNSELCPTCIDAARQNNKLDAWNEALIRVSINIVLSD